VVAVDLPGAALDETVRLVTAAGGTAIAVGADVRDEAQVKAFIAAAVDT
jgi:3-oxoacyl-[acyl-carrier protein] reductase